MKIILEITNTVVNSYGISIIIMSIIVNTVLIPLYLFAEKLQEKELNIRKKLQPSIDEFNLAFSGYERFAYIKTLYRIHRYHPIAGLRSLIGLMIQAPFFIAAYHFLKDYAPLSGTGFSVIHNLSQPDALLHIGTISINALPIIMTAINIIAGSIYVQRKNPKGITQILGMSMIFLILLYHTSSGLVLYWTMNNIYSLVKNIILSKKEHNYSSFFKEIAYTGTTLKKQWSILYNSTTKIRNIIVFLWALSCYLLLAYFLYLKNRIGGATPLALLYSAWGISVVTIINMLNIIRIQIRTHILKIILLGGMGIYLVISAALVLYHAYMPSQTVIDQQKMITVQNILMTLAGLGLSTLLLPVVIQYGKNNGGHTSRSAYISTEKLSRYKGIGVMVLVYSMIAMLIIGVANPLEVFNSDPFAFEGFVMKSFFAITLKWFIAVAALLYAAYYLIPNRYKCIYAAAIITGVLIICTNTYVIPFRYGLLNQFQFDTPDALLTSYPWYIVEGTGIVLLCYFVYVHLIKNRWLLHALSILIIIIVLFKTSSAIITYNTDIRSLIQAKMQGTVKAPQVSDTDTYFNKKEHQLLDFSRTGNNVLVLILDTFPGGYIAPILEEFPELKNTFDGFVWYPNTLTGAHTTIWSYPLLIGGITWSVPTSMENRQYTKSKNKREIAAYLPALYDTLLGFYSSHDYAISLASYRTLSSYNCTTGKQILQTITNKPVDLRCNEIDTTYTNYWRKNQQTKKLIPLTIPLTAKEKSRLLAAIESIRALPVMAKYWWYNKGRWGFLTDKTPRQWQVNEWAFLNTMKEFSRVTDNTGNTFKLFHSEIIHEPLILDNTCNIAPNLIEHLNGQYHGIGQYNAARCVLHLLGTYITWLKRAGIYDNTKIVLLSDHGRAPVNAPSDSKEIYYEAYSSLTKNYGDTFDPQTIGFRHALLLVKDYHARGVIKTDTRFMSNADLRSILCGKGNTEFTEYCTTEENPTHIEPPLNRTLYSYRMHTKNPRIFKVQHNIFDPKNWTEIPFANK